MEEQLQDAQGRLERLRQQGAAPAGAADKELQASACLLHRVVLLWVDWDACLTGAAMQIEMLLVCAADGCLTIVFFLGCAAGRVRGAARDDQLQRVPPAAEGRGDHKVLAHVLQPVHQAQSGCVRGRGGAGCRSARQGLMVSIVGCGKWHSWMACAAATCRPACVCIHVQIIAHSCLLLALRQSWRRLAAPQVPWLRRRLRPGRRQVSKGVMERGVACNVHGMSALPPVLLAIAD